VKYLAIGFVHVYRWAVSPLLGNRCKYHPSCSQYALGAFREYGFLKGLILVGWRLLRCNPWSHGGVDYAKDQSLFQRGGTHGSPASPLLPGAGNSFRRSATPGQARLRRQSRVSP
jgi:putative membrane protein insertion efficiency factor